jgi:diguanylate cyclase (GGDEF)-like protein
MAAADEAEDAGRLEHMELLAREALSRAIAANEADLVVDCYAILGRRLGYTDDWPGLLREVQPALVWLPRAQDPIPCIRLAGMLAVVYASFRQVDRAFGLISKLVAAHDCGSGEPSYLLQTKLGELNLHLGRPAEAAGFLRIALRMLDTCSAEQRTPHRRTITRLLLASALLLTATAERQAGSAQWAGPLTEVMQCLDEAETTVADVPVLSVSLDVARGYCLSLCGRDDPVLKARLIGLSDQALGSFLPPTLPCLFDWVALQAAAGDVSFGRAVLEKTDPRRELLPWPHLKPMWYRTQGEVLAAEGDSHGAVQALRQSIIEDRCNREREISTVVAMAERAAQADEMAERERAALARADSLELSNASLSAETQRWNTRAQTDTLTGLRNRLGLEHFLAAVQSSTPASEWTVVVIDIDHFKSVNDVHSHRVGDEVLAAVAQVLAAAVRENDVAVRWGGEEFVLVLRHHVGLARLDAIRRAVQGFDWSSLLPDRRVTISLGAAVWAAPEEFADVLARADQRLYAAKHAGRNRVVAA